MSGEHRRMGGFMLPAIVVIAGIVYALSAARNGTLSAAALKPVNWAGLALMAAGVAAAFMKTPSAHGPKRQLPMRPCAGHVRRRFVSVRN